MPSITPAPSPTDPVDRPGDGRTMFDSLARAVGAVIFLIILAGYAVGAAGCDNFPVKPSTTRQPVETPSTNRDNAVNRVCYQFHRYTINDLARTVVEGDVTYLASLPAVPVAVRTAVDGYYGDARVRQPGTLAGKTAADAAYGKVDAACRDAGWKTGQKADDQPPKR